MLRDSSYVPDTGEVKNVFLDGAREWGESEDVVSAEFDRWLRSVKADAFEQGFYVASDGQFFPEPGENPYREEEK